VISFKKPRRQHSKSKRGHPQDLTVVRITEILLGGAQPTAKAAASEDKPKRAPRAKKAEGEAAEAAEA